MTSKLPKRGDVRVSYSLRTLAEIDVRAKSEGVSRHQFIVSATMKALRSSEFVAHEFKEVQIGTHSNTPVDTILEALAARRVLLAELVPRGTDHVSARLRKAMRRVLTKEQAGRVEKVLLKGLTLEEVGMEEGVSKQAVHAALQRAVGKLKKDPDFLSVLVSMFPESGVTVPMLLKMQYGGAHGAA